MAIRTARRGVLAGTQFLGCSNYFETGCTGKLEIPKDLSPRAGASAQARFEREERIRKAKVRGFLPTFFGLVIVVMIGAYLVFVQIHPVLAAAAVLVILVAMPFGLARLPSDALFWDKGAKGERKTAEELEPLERLGYILIHDRQVPGARDNIDHVAIGPSGIYVIETKNLSGKIEVVHERLTVGEHDRQRFIEQVYRQSVATQIALSGALNPLRLTVVPILCIHGARLPWFDHEVAGVQLLGGRAVEQFIRKQPAVLDEQQVQVLAREAAERLRPVPSWEL